jgi:hypothetical protein
MDLEQRVQRTIESRTEFLAPWSADPVAVHRAARLRTRRRLAGAGAGVVAVASLAVVAALAGPSPSDSDSIPPVVQPDELVPPDGLVPPPGRVVEVSTSGAAPSAAQVRGSMDSDDPGYAGDAEVSVTAYTVGEYGWEFSCVGAPDTFWVLTIEPNATYYESGRCDLPKGGQAFMGDQVVRPQGDADVDAGTKTLRLFLTDENPRRFQRCFEYSPPEGCDEVEPPHAVGTAAKFGVTLLDQPPAPAGVTLVGVDVSEVASWDGRVWRLAAAVEAAPGAEGLSHRLEPSTRDRIVQVLPDYESRETKTPLLEVDGEPIEAQGEAIFSGRGGSVVLPAGGGHDLVLTSEAAQGLGLVVFEAD